MFDLTFVMLRTRSISARPELVGSPFSHQRADERKKLRRRGLLIASCSAALPTLNLQFSVGPDKRRTFVCARSRYWTVGEKGDTPQAPRSHLETLPCVSDHFVFLNLNQEVGKVESGFLLWGRCMMLMCECVCARACCWARVFIVRERGVVCLTKAARLSRLSHPAGRNKAAGFEV